MPNEVRCHRPLILSCAVIIWALLCSERGWADFTDEIPGLFGTGTPTPRPTLSPVQPSSPSTGGSPLVVPTPGAAATPTGSPQPVPAGSAAPGPSEKGGDFGGGNVFGDIRHDTNAPVTLPSPARKFRASRTDGTAILEGDVVVEQDGLRITSDRVELFTNKLTNKAQKAQALGHVYVRKKASTRPGDTLEAWADELEYNIVDGVMILRKNAQIARGKDCRIHGEVLEYQLTSGFVTGTAIRGTCLPLTMTTPRPKPKTK